MHGSSLRAPREEPGRDRCEVSALLGASKETRWVGRERGERGDERGERGDERGGQGPALYPWTTKSMLYVLMTQRTYSSDIT